MDGQRFERIQINGWRQFGEVDIDLSRQVTILTGSNGCGKTSLLNVLGAHFGWNIQFVRTPYLGRRRREKLRDDLRDRNEWADLSLGSTDDSETIGRIHYSQGEVCKLIVPQKPTVSYQLKYINRADVTGLTIPSHRPAAVYNEIREIPIEPKSAAQHFSEYQQIMQQVYSSTGRINPGSIIKKSLLSLALFGPGNQLVEENSEYLELLERFQDVLRKVLPKEIGFEKFHVKAPDVVLRTRSGIFSIDSMSGGVNALVTIAWQILMHSIDNDYSTIIIDEPENHLHPSMQRTLLSSLASAFPNCQFIVATHSPFVVTSMRTAAVYGLAPDKESHRIVSSKIDIHNLAGTPNKILREVLMVPSLTPVWAEERISRILHVMSNAPPKETAKAIYDEMKELGMAEGLSDFSITGEDSEQ